MPDFNLVNNNMRLSNLLNQLKTQASSEELTLQNQVQGQNAQGINQPAQVNTQNAQNLTQSNLAQNTQNTQSAQTPATTYVYNLDMAKMDADTVQKYIQTLLNVPESLEEFVAQAQTQAKDVNSKEYQFLKIFVQNLINTDVLAQILNQNSKDAIQKLYTMISTVLKAGSKDATQLKEILAILSAIQTTTSTSSSGALKDLILLYIPVNCQIYFEKDDFNTDEADEILNSQNALTILFETVNFSNILVTINEDNNDLFLALFAHQDFGFTRFKNIIQTMAKEQNISVMVDFRNIKQEQNNTKRTQNFKIISNKFISPNALLLTKIIVKTIFSMDDNFTQAEEN